MRTHAEIFTEIYANNVWGGSGGGSTPENTVEYRALLQKFLKDHNIKSVVDYGCGDWSFSNKIDWTGLKYLGVDCVVGIVEINKVKYATANIFFAVTELLPPSDLLIVKDVFQHWPNRDIDEFMFVYASSFKYILITNTCNQKFDNQNLVNQMRPLSAKFEPLKKYNPKILAVIKTTETKEVSLISR